MLNGHHANGHKADEACNGRGHKDSKRYIVQHRVYTSDSWMDVQNASFVAVNDALLYASMCSCYPVIYGMTRVVDTLDGRVVQTYSAGEGQLTPKQHPDRYYLQLRYTVTPKGETWGWLSRSFLSFEAAIDFTRRQLLPRNICDAVRVIKDNHNFLTWYYTEEAVTKFTIKDAPRSDVFEDFLKRYYPRQPQNGFLHEFNGKPVTYTPASPARPRNDAADALAYAAATCPKPCPRDTNGDGDCPRCAPAAGHGGLPKTLLGFPVEVSHSTKGKHFVAGPIPNYQELGGRVLDVPRVREWFKQWFRGRFKTEYNENIEVHCAMFVSFRAAMEIRVLRQHQS